MSVEADYLVRVLWATCITLEAFSFGFIASTAVLLCKECLNVESVVLGFCNMMVLAATLFYRNTNYNAQFMGLSTLLTTEAAEFVLNSVLLQFTTMGTILVYLRLVIIFTKILLYTALLIRLTNIHIMTLNHSQSCLAYPSHC